MFAYYNSVVSYLNRKNSKSDMEAKIKRYLPIVLDIVQNFSQLLPSHVEREDIFAFGMEGLIAALKNESLEKQAGFSTYVRIRVKGAIQDELRRRDHISRQDRAQVKMLKTAKENLEKKLRREVNYEEAAKHAKVDLATVQDALIGECEDVSLESDNIIEPSQFNALWQVEKDPEEECEKKLESETVSGLFASLSQREQTVLMFYYIEGKTLKEIGANLRLTESRVCQIHNNAIKKLRSLYKQQSASLAKIRAIKKGNQPESAKNIATLPRRPNRSQKVA